MKKLIFFLIILANFNVYSEDDEDCKLREEFLTKSFLNAENDLKTIIKKIVKKMKIQKLFC